MEEITVQEGKDEADKVELNIITLGCDVKVKPPQLKGSTRKPFFLRAGTEGVILWKQKLGMITYFSVFFAKDIPTQLIGFNSAHTYDTVMRKADDNLKLVLDKQPES